MTSGMTLSLDPARSRTNLHERVVNELRPYAQRCNRSGDAWLAPIGLRPSPGLGSPRPGWQNGPPTGSQHDGAARPWEGHLRGAQPTVVDRVHRLTEGAPISL